MKGNLLLSGIYAIFNDDICLYVGSSSSIIKRIQTHQQQLNSNKHNNRTLQRYYDNADGMLTFTALEIVMDKELLFKREQHFSNIHLPVCCCDVPCLALASDAFKIYMFPRLLGQIRSERFRR